MTAKRGVEHRAAWQMRFLLNWINFWIEVQETGEGLGELGEDFAIMQIDNLQRTLERLRVKLEKSQNQAQTPPI